MAALSVLLSDASAADQDPGRNVDCDDPEDDRGDHQCGHGWLLKVGSREPASLCFPGLHEALAR
jgi:hypothetical protein